MSASDLFHRASCLSAAVRCALIAFVPDTSQSVPWSAAGEACSCRNNHDDEAKRFRVAALVVVML